MIGEFTNLDNDTYNIDLVQLGAFGGVDSTTGQYNDFDEFESLPDIPALIFEGILCSRPITAVR